MKFEKKLGRKPEQEGGKARKRKQDCIILLFLQMICLLWIADVCVHVCAHVCVYMWCMITCVWRRTQPCTYADAKRGFQYLPPSLSIILIFFWGSFSPWTQGLPFSLSDWPASSCDLSVSISQHWCSRYSRAQPEIRLHFPALVFQVQPCSTFTWVLRV